MKAMTSLCALLVSASMSAAAVEIRVREMTGQSVASPSDPTLNFTVEARVVGEANRGLGDVSFDVRFSGEAESAGTFSRLRISEADGSYYQGAPTTSTTGAGFVGWARQYRYLVNLNSVYNGSINQSIGPFTNTPDQELGYLLGTARGTEFLAPTGIIVESQTNPSGYEAASGAARIASLNTWFGANGNWIELYRFRYTVLNFSQRALDMRLNTGLVASVFSELVQGGSGGSDWSVFTLGGSRIPTVTTPTLSVIPSPALSGAMCLAGLAGMIRRRR